MPTLSTTRPTNDLGNRYQSKTFETLKVTGASGASGTLEVKLNGSSVSSSSVLLGATIDVSIPKSAFTALNYTATHSVQFLLTDAGGTGSITFTFKRIPTPLSPNDSLATATESFKEFIDSREQLKAQLIADTNALGSM